MTGKAIVAVNDAIVDELGVNRWGGGYLDVVGLGWLGRSLNGVAGG